MKLSNKVAVVTGASKGLGRAIAYALAKEGADVVVNYCQSEKSAAETAAKIKSLGRQAMPVKADVGNKKEVDAMFQQVFEKFGRVDILVNNAGIAPYKPFLEIDESLWDRVLAVNLKSVFLCSQSVVDRMKGKANLKIINMSSVGGSHAQKFLSAYDASKGGIEALTREMAVELAPFGIRVNAVAPGAILVERNRTILENYKEIYKKIVPQGRVGTVEDVARVVVFLATDDSDYINGQVITIDGGTTAQIIEPEFGPPAGVKKYSLKKR